MNCGNLIGIKAWNRAFGRNDHHSPCRKMGWAFAMFEVIDRLSQRLEGVISPLGDTAQCQTVTSSVSILFFALCRRTNTNNASFT